MRFCFVCGMLLLTLFSFLVFLSVVPGFLFRFPFRPTSKYYRYKMSRGNDDKDYLPDKYNQESKKSSSTSNGLFGGIAKLFGQDEQSKEKRRRQEAVNTAVDKVFQDLNFENAGLVGGLVGGLFKSVAKGVGGMVAEMAAESAGDLQAVQRGVEALLDDDPRTSNLLGEPVACGQPSSTSSSSMSINGRSQRSVMLVMPVFGSKTDALVEVAATLEASGGTLTNSFCIVKFIYWILALNLLLSM